MLQTLKSMPVTETQLVYCAPKYLCNKILSWMIKIWMKFHLVSDNYCNDINYNPFPETTRNDE
jgi:hypothetical protein